MLVERGQFLETLSGLLAEVAQSGDGRLIFLGGEAGVGKSTLAGALLTSAPEGFGIRRGASDNLTTAAALGPLVEALPEIADELAEGARVDRVKLVARIREVLGGAPTLVLIEDLHWADEATLDALRVIGSRLAGLPVLILTTFRADEVAPDHPLTVLLGDLATVSGVVRMQLPALSLGGVRQLVEESGSALDPAELLERTGGNPFYVTEVLAASGDAVPATVRDAVLARAHRLSPDARRVLAAAAVLGRVDLHLLVAVSGATPADVDECVLRGVLVPDGADLAFRHELARLTIENAQTPGELAALHAAALRSLQSANGADDRRLAYHAAGAGEHVAVLEHAPRAARHAARLGAHREAAELYRLALRSGDPDERVRAALSVALSYECYLTDQLQEAIETRAEAMRLAEQIGDALAVGVAQRWLSRLSWFFGRNEDAERWAARSIATLEPLGESAELAMAYSNLAQLRMLGYDTHAAIEEGERAIALARRVGDRDVEIHALNNVGTAHFIAGNGQLGEQLLTASLEMALADDAEEHVARAYTNLGTSSCFERRYEVAERYLRAGIDYCADRDLDSWRLYMSSSLATVCAERGRLAAAARTASDVIRHPHLSPITAIGASVVLAQLALRAGRPDGGRLDTALRLAEATGELQRRYPVAVARAEAAWLAGRFEEIVPEVDGAWAAAVERRHIWALGEISWWLMLAGAPAREVPVPVAAPYAAMLAEDWPAAAQLWDELACPVWQAHALGRSPELADARRSVEILDELELPALRDAVLRERHQLGLAVPRGPRAASRSNQWGLTAREIEILQLLTEGLSNAELAGRLFLSDKTVGHHVSAILRKLGEPSRSRAVAAARKHGIVSPT